MKKFKVKGFTLIELLVVMAIFGILMAGAMQLIPSVTKMMVQSTLHEDGNAAVSSISKYLEGELSSVEYLTVANYIPDDDGQELVKDFVLSYYEGVLANGATIDNQIYGTGKVHVMTINNNDHGKITKHVYDVKFDIPKKAADQITPSDFIEGEKITYDYGVNKAYYDNYDFLIIPGPYVPEEKNEDAEEEEEAPMADEINLVDGITANNTNFNITAVSKRRRNGQIYSFRTNSSMSLTNIQHRRGRGVSGRYYVIDQSEIANVVTNSISDISREVPTPISSYTDEHNLSRHEGYVATGMKLKYGEPAEDDKGSFTFVYSYASEIKTN